MEPRHEKTGMALQRRRLPSQVRRRMAYSFASFYVLVGLLLVAPYSACGGDKPVRTVETLSPDWVPIPTPQRGAEAWTCGTRSRTAWRVTQTEGALRITATEFGERRADPLPFPLEEGNRFGTPRSHRFATMVADGWIVGLGAGEFGGSLWWFSPTGEQKARIAEVPVRGVTTLGGSPVVLTGTAHADTDTGQLLELSRAANGEWRIERRTDLGAAPEAYATAPDGPLFVMTSKGLLRLTQHDNPTRLTSEGYFGLHPNSIAVTRSGVCLIGMNHFVVRLTPVRDGYKDEWFVNRTCRHFRMDDDECVCSGR